MIRKKLVELEMRAICYLSAAHTFPSVQECDATGDGRRTTAGFTKKNNNRRQKFIKK